MLLELFTHSLRLTRVHGRKACFLNIYNEDSFEQFTRVDTGYRRITVQILLFSKFGFGTVQILTEWLMTDVRFISTVFRRRTRGTCFFFNFIHVYGQKGGVRDAQYNPMLSTAIGGCYKRKNHVSSQFSEHDGLFV